LSLPKTKRFSAFQLYHFLSFKAMHHQRLFPTADHFAHSYDTWLWWFLHGQATCLPAPPVCA